MNNEFNQDNLSSTPINEVPNSVLEPPIQPEVTSFPPVQNVTEEPAPISEIPSVSPVEINSEPSNDVGAMGNVVTNTEPTGPAPMASSQEPIMTGPQEVNNAPVNNVTTEPTNNVIADTSQNNFYEKEKKKWPIVLLLIVLIIGGAFAYYYFVATNPKTIITKVVNATFAKVKNVDTGSTLKADTINTIKMDGNVILTSSAEDYKELSGLTAKFGIGYDLQDTNKNKIDLSMSLQGQNLTDMSITTTKDKMYYDFKDAYPKTLTVENADSEMDFSIDIPNEEEIKANREQVIYLIEKVKETFLANVSDSNLSKEIAFKDVDGKKMPVVEVTYKVDAQEYKKVIYAIYDALLADNKSLQALGNIYGNETMASELLQEMKSSVSETDIDGTLYITISVDAITSKLVELELKTDNSKTTIIQKSGELNITFNAKDSTEEMVINVTIDENEKKVFADVKITEEEETERFAITFKINTIDDKGFDVSGSLIVYDTEDVNKEALSLALQLNAEYNKEIETVNMTDTVDMESLSEEEAEQVTNAMMGILGLMSAFGEE